METTEAETTRIGHYTLVRKIGSGGRGVVFEALQDEPHRKVALKLLSVSNASSRERWRYEAEVLGRLKHPAIAQIHEAGFDAEAGDYFAMEFVEGARHIDEYVRAEKLSIDAIVELFVEVCAAVAHGHEKGVLHRDLKPANILVDAHGRPKLIDFGVARAIDAERSRGTSTGELVGTLQYMSPEQVGGDPARVDVRSDVHALGVVLFELVAGRLPLELAGLGLAEAARRICDEAPARLREARPDADVELEWIVSKALEKDPARRYASAALLADDLQRYLAREPIAAGPATTSYRVRVFVRRNRFALAATVVFALLLVAGSALAWLARGRSLALAEEARIAERAADDRASQLARELAANREILAQQASWLSTNDLDLAGRDARLADVLDRAAKALDETPPTDPHVEAELRFALAEAYDDLALWPATNTQVARTRAAIARGGMLAPDKLDTLARLEARMLALSGDEIGGLALAQAHVEDVRARLGAEHRSYGTALETLASVERSIDDLENAERHLREAIAVLSSGGVEWTRGPRSTLARILQSARRNDEALVVARSLVDDLRAAPSTQRSDLLVAESVLAKAYYGVRKPAEALTLFERVRSGYEALHGTDTALIYEIDFEMCDCFTDQGDVPRALSLARRGAEGYARVLGVDHARTREAQPKLAMLMIQGGAVDEGMATFDSILKDRVTEFGAESSFFLELEFGYAHALGDRRVHLDRATELLGDVVTRGRRVWKDRLLQWTVASNELAVISGWLGRYDRALDLLNENLSIVEKLKGRYDLDTISTVKNLGEMSRGLGHDDEAECWWRDAHARRLARYGRSIPAAWSLADSLSDLLSTHDATREADALAATAIRALSTDPKTDPAKLGRLLLVRARCAVRLGDARRAREAFGDALAHAWRRFSETSALRATIESSFATFLLDDADFDGALALLEPLLERHEITAKTRREALLTAAAAHAGAGRPERAAELRARAQESSP